MKRQKDSVEDMHNASSVETPFVWINCSNTVDGTFLPPLCVAEQTKGLIFFCSATAY